MCVVSEKNVIRVRTYMYHRHLIDANSILSSLGFFLCSGRFTSSCISQMDQEIINETASKITCLVRLVKIAKIIH